MELYKIIEILEKKKIEYYIEEDDTRENYIRIYACSLGDNFFDYGEDEKDLQIDDVELKFLENESKVSILKCCDCCGCAGW